MYAHWAEKSGWLEQIDAGNEQDDVCSSLRCRNNCPMKSSPSESDTDKPPREAPGSSQEGKSEFRGFEKKIWPFSSPDLGDLRPKFGKPTPK
jgi:hypothetical protein